MNQKLIKKIFIHGSIRLLTGLRIGGSSSAMSIGGLDNIIIRNPIDNKPYIPGSSLKGKMRSLIELREGTIGNRNMGSVKHGPSEEAGAWLVAFLATRLAMKGSNPRALLCATATCIRLKKFSKYRSTLCRSKNRSGYRPYNFGRKSSHHGTRASGCQIFAEPYHQHI